MTNLVPQTYENYLAYLPDDRARNYVKFDRARRKSVSVSPDVVRLCRGNANDALILSQILYWHGTDDQDKPRLRYQRDGHLWLVKQYADFEEETGVSERVVRDAINRLEKLGLIYRYVGISPYHVGALPRASFIRMNWIAFFDALEAVEEARNATKKRTGQSAQMTNNVACVVTEPDTPKRQITSDEKRRITSDGKRRITSDEKRQITADVYTDSTSDSTQESTKAEKPFSPVGEVSSAPVPSQENGASPAQPSVNSVMTGLRTEIYDMFISEDDAESTQESTAESTQESTAESTQENGASPAQPSVNSVMTGLRTEIYDMFISEDDAESTQESTAESTQENTQENTTDSTQESTAADLPQEMEQIEFLSVADIFDMFIAETLEPEATDGEPHEPTTPDLTPEEVSALLLSIMPAPKEKPTLLLSVAPAPEEATWAKVSEWVRTDFPHYTTLESIVSHWGRDTRQSYTANHTRIQAAVAFMFDIAKGSYAGKRAQQLLGTGTGKYKDFNITPAMTPTEIVAFKAWYKTTYPEQRMVEQAEQVQDYVLRFRDHLLQLSQQDKKQVAELWQQAESKLASLLGEKDPHATVDQNNLGSEK